MILNLKNYMLYGHHTQGFQLNLICSEMLPDLMINSYLGFHLPPGLPPIRGRREDEGGLRLLQRDDHQRPRGRLRRRRLQRRCR